MTLISHLTWDWMRINWNWTASRNLLATNLILLDHICSGWSGQINVVLAHLKITLTIKLNIVIDNTHQHLGTLQVRVAIDIDIEIGTLTWHPKSPQLRRLYRL